MNEEALKAYLTFHALMNLTIQSLTSYGFLLTFSTTLDYLYDPSYNKATVLKYGIARTQLKRSDFTTKYITLRNLAKVKGYSLEDIIVGVHSLAGHLYRYNLVSIPFTTNANRLYYMTKMEAYTQFSSGNFIHICILL